ncbi:MAG: polysaccharide biosynthesis tyrosine autokinase [Sphingorhabdus sp.]
MANEALQSGGNGLIFRDNQLTLADGFSAENADASSMSLPQLLDAFRRRKWLILALILVGSLLGLAVTLATTPIYEARSQIEINPDTVAAVDVEQNPGSRIRIDGIFLQTQTELLKVRVLRERVARDQKLDLNDTIVNQNLSPRKRLEGAVDWLGKNVSIVNISDTRIFTVDVTSPSAKLSADIANSYAKNFISANLEKQFESSGFARDFLSEQLKETREKLEDSEIELVSYARSHQIIDIGTQDSVSGSTRVQTLPAANLARLNDAYADAKSKRIVAEQRSRNADGLSRGVSANDRNIKELQGDIARLRAEYAQKRQIYKPDYPQMVELQRRIDAMRRSINGLSSDDRRGNTAGLVAELRAAQGEERALARQLEKLKSTVLGERSLGIQYGILQREVDTNRALYDALLQRYKEVGVAGGNVENLITLVDKAQPPRGAVRPILMVNLILGLFGGLGVAVAFVLLSDILNDRIRSPVDVERRLNLKLIGLVPESDEDVGFSELINDPKSPIYEAYLSIVNQLRFATSEGFPKSLLISSTVPAEGKSSTAFAIAKILSRQKRKVLLIDSDLRMPTFVHGGHEVLAEVAGGNQGTAQHKAGLVNLIVGDRKLDEAIVKVENHFDLLPAGDIPPNPAEILSSIRLVELLEELAGNYDAIIIDGPPVLGFADAPILSSIATSSLMVIAADEARTSQIRSTLKRLQDSEASIVGAVLTRVKGGADDYGHNYAYDYRQNSQTSRNGGFARKRGKADQDGRSIRVTEKNG